MADQTDLSAVLSQLLERYLVLLDLYQSLQAKLTQLLSSGYISLAQANFSPSARCRYGQDFYDDRMQATKKLRIATSSDKDNLALSLELVDVKESEGDSLKEVPESSSLTDGSATIQKTKLKSRDPLQWFGILVPPALRTAQNEFTGAVVDVVPKLVEVTAEMRIYETRIYETRKILDARRGLEGVVNFNSA